jgi:DDE superfamily endonuclease
MPPATRRMNVQVACTLAGRLAWISDPVDGTRHDTYCLRESGVLLTLDPGSWIGDKGYVGNDMITPIKKPAHRKLLDWEKEFNKQVNKIRYVIEQATATSRPGESCTPTIAGPWQHSPQPSQP